VGACLGSEKKAYGLRRQSEAATALWPKRVDCRPNETPRFGQPPYPALRRDVLLRVPISVLRATTGNQRLVAAEHIPTRPTGPWLQHQSKLRNIIDLDQASADAAVFSGYDRGVSIRWQGDGDGGFERIGKR
jgi:hypothetical protein